MIKNLKYLILFLVATFFGLLGVKADFVNVNYIHSDEIPNSSYVIGTHMFTRNVNSDYGYYGRLTTKLIMIASKTIYGNSMDDMIIYYKNARGNWVDALTMEAIEVNDLLEIEFIDNQTYVPTPILHYVALGTPDYTIPHLNNGRYTYEFSICNGPDEFCNVEGYELYRKTSDGYIFLDDGEVDAVIAIELEPGTNNTFVARGYVGSENNKKFSHYSDEIVIDLTKPLTPELGVYGNGIGDSNNNINIIVLDDGYYSYEFYIDNIRSYYDFDEEISSISGYELYKVQNNDYELVSLSGVGNPSEIIGLEIEPGVYDCYVARVYAINTNNEKIYSDYSSNKCITQQFQKPVLQVQSFGNATYYEASINYNNYISGDSMTSISGYELYKYVNNIPVLVEEVNLASDVIPIDLTSNVPVSYTARVFAYNRSHQKVYSDYSNIVVVGD